MQCQDIEDWPLAFICIDRGDIPYLCVSSKPIIGPDPFFRIMFLQIVSFDACTPPALGTTHHHLRRPSTEEVPPDGLAASLAPLPLAAEGGGVVGHQNTLAEEQEFRILQELPSSHRSSPPSNTPQKKLT